ncbi:CoA transferase subunit B [Rhodococcus qingshengii]|jgi:3-oxoacid CoA-transferase B subunit|nr:CoA transferase subunit B [Rhodococcus qingshengii]
MEKLKFDPKQMIARRVAKELKNGAIVNLGIGIPTMVAEFIPNNIQVFLHSENGMLGVGRFPKEGELDPEIINAGKIPVTEKQGASYFSSSESFAIIRGGHVDTVILGALQVSETGDIANWAVPGKDVLGVGGAMDLVVGAREVIVATQHITKDGKPKIVPSCTYPLTAQGVVDTIVTEYAVLRSINKELVLEEIADGWTIEELKEVTTANFRVSRNLKIYQ